MGEKVYLIFYELSKLLFNLLQVNVLSMIVTLPVLIIGIQIAVTTELSNLFILVPIVSLLLPVLFFPGLQAVISSVRQLIREEGVLTPLSFLKHYTLGYKHSFIIGMGITGCLTLIGTSLLLNREGLIILNILLLVMLFYTSLFGFYSLFMDAHYKMPISWIIKRVFYMISTSPIFTLTVYIAIILLQVIIYTVSPIVYILFGPAITIYMSYYLFLKKLGHYTDHQTDNGLGGNK
ncbi:MAG: DUF624 domain-containing protein [Alkalibacterium sp.]|nr:DUF624 domain-containing protein [Alkalibacterium sp.]